MIEKAPEEVKPEDQAVPALKEVVIAPVEMADGTVLYPMQRATITGSVVIEPIDCYAELTAAWEQNVKNYRKDEFQNISLQIPQDGSPSDGMLGTIYE